MGGRGRLRVRVFCSEHAHKVLEADIFGSAHAQNRKLVLVVVLVVVLVIRSKGP